LRQFAQKVVSQAALSSIRVHSQIIKAIAVSDVTRKNIKYNSSHACGENFSVRNQNTPKCEGERSWGCWPAIIAAILFIVPLTKPPSGFNISTQQEQQQAHGESGCKLSRPFAFCHHQSQLRAKMKLWILSSCACRVRVFARSAVTFGCRKCL
jgi:hypothetical protein